VVLADAGGGILPRQHPAVRVVGVGDVVPGGERVALLQLLSGTATGDIVVIGGACVGPGVVDLRELVRVVVRVADALAGGARLPRPAAEAVVGETAHHGRHLHPRRLQRGGECGIGGERVARHGEQAAEGAVGVELVVPRAVVFGNLVPEDVVGRLL